MHPTPVAPPRGPVLVGDTFYRAEVGTAGGVYFGTFRVEKVTPCGMWLLPTGGVLRSLRLTWRPFGTRFVSRSEEEAWAHLRARKRSYVKHCLRRLAQAEREYVSAGGARDDLEQMQRRQLHDAAFNSFCLVLSDD